MFQVTCFKCGLRSAAMATSLLLIVTLRPNLQAAASEGTLSSTGTWLASGVEELPGLPMGPFVRLGDGSILTVDTASSAIVSRDEGKTWESRPIFAETAKYAIRPERAILRTPSGVIILAFANDKERANWNWDKAISDSPGARLPTYAMRSPDDGKTWTDPVVIARNKKGWIAYPYLFEARPGERWITTMQGGLRVRLHEEDFVGK
jgi:hypothetical protein